VQEFKHCTICTLQLSGSSCGQQQQQRQAAAVAAAAATGRSGGSSSIYVIDHLHRALNIWNDKCWGVHLTTKTSQMVSETDKESHALMPADCCIAKPPKTTIARHWL
jgi:hypothetical protein